MKSRIPILGLVLMTLLFAAGCKKRVVLAAVPITVPTTAPPTSTQPAPIPPEILPDGRPPDQPTGTVVMMEPPPAPPTRPVRRPPEAQPQPEAPKPQPPQISPRLTAGELAAYQRTTTDAMRRAQDNLSRANGRVLNTAQQDLLEKIRSFLAQTQEAIQLDDWVRAHDLSHKAELLSVELANSLG